MQKRGDATGSSGCSSDMRGSDRFRHDKAIRPMAVWGRLADRTYPNTPAANPATAFPFGVPGVMMSLGSAFSIDPLVSSAHSYP